MTRTEAKNYIVKKFVDEYNDETPYVLDNNENFVKPENDVWVEFSVRYADAEQATIGEEGGRRFSRKGVIAYNVYIPPNTGTYDGDVLCEQINNIFEGKRFEQIICKTGTWKELGMNDQDEFQFYGYIYFELDEKK